MPRKEDHEVHKDMWWHWTQKKNPNLLHDFYGKCLIQQKFFTRYCYYIFVVTTYVSRGMHPELCDLIAKNSDANLELQASIPPLR